MVVFDSKDAVERTMKSFALGKEIAGSFWQKKSFAVARIGNSRDFDKVFSTRVFPRLGSKLSGIYF
jgi:hypothetical protein